MKILSHFVFPSFHPFSLSFGSMLLLSGFHLWFLFGVFSGVLISFFFIFFSYSHWWSMVGRERSNGSHSSLVTDGLKIGMIMFIMSEVFFFSSFFWAFFHSTFSPSMESGGVWPPIFFLTMNPNNIPLVNTAILLSSGAVITWAHSDLLGNKGSILPLGLTIFLGLYFLLIQGAEYLMSPLTISDGAYGSIFFVATGFHGTHVLIGVLFLFITLVRFMLNRFTSWSHLSYEMAIWYWHFVDVVWLFLFSFIYYWGN